MGILDTAKAFAHVGVSKATNLVAGAAAKGVHLAGDAASKGAARLNRAADGLDDDSAPGGQSRGTTDEGTTR